MRCWGKAFLMFYLGPERIPTMKEEKDGDRCGIWNLGQLAFGIGNTRAFKAETKDVSPRSVALNLGYDSYIMDFSLDKSHCAQVMVCVWGLDVVNLVAETAELGGP